MQPLKWTAEDFAEYDQGKMPMGKPQVEWSYGDVEAGFKEAALVLDETFSMANNQHHVLEPRTALAYWRGEKLHMHTGTQSAVQTVASISRWMNMRARERRAHHRVHRRRLRQPGDRRGDLHDPGAAGQEGQRAR